MVNGAGSVIDQRAILRALKAGEHLWPFSEAAFTFRRRLSAFSES